MVSTEDIDTILTVEDLKEHLLMDLDHAGGDPRITIWTEDCELFLACEHFSRGLCIGVDTMGRWVLQDLVLHDIDVGYAKCCIPYTTESIMTVFRAVAKWMEEARKPHEPVVRYRFNLFRKEIIDT